MTNLDPNSLTDFLKSGGKDTSLTSRASLAVTNGLVKTPQEYISLASKGQNADINTKLLGILRGAKTETPTTGITSPLAVTDNNDANAFINGDQKKDFDIATTKTGDEPPIKASTKSYEDMFSNLKSTISPTTKAPETPNFLDTFKTYRDSYGVTDLETSLTELKKSAQAIKDLNTAQKFNEEGKPVAMNVIEGRMSEEAKQNQVKLDAINREIENTSSQLETKYNVINNLMTYAKLDYTNAVDKYDSDFSQNLQLFNTVKGIVESEKSDTERMEDNARANLQIIYNNISSGGSDINAITPDEKANITKLEVQAGLPVGFYKSLQVKNPKSDILSTTTRESGGLKYADVIMKNADGTLSVKSISLGASKSGSGDNDLTASEDLKLAYSKVAPQLQSRRGDDGYVAPEDYRRARDAWAVNLPVESFDKQFKQYANPESYTLLGISF